MCSLSRRRRSWVSWWNSTLSSTTSPSRRPSSPSTSTATGSVSNSQLFYRPLSRLARAVSHLCLCLTISKTLHTCQPLGLSKLISHYLPSRSVRSSNTNLLPPGITSNFSSRAFSVSAPSTWNSLPAHIRSIDTLSTFKRHVKFHLFQSAFTV